MSNGILGDIVVHLVDLLNVITVLAVCTICPFCLDSCIVTTKTMVVINKGVSGRVPILVCPFWNVCIVGVAHTPMGGFLGTLSSLPATKLGSIVIECALKRAHVHANLVQEVFFGNVLSANLERAPARQAALGAGIPNSVVCTTINNVCSSGMKATMLAAQSIQLGINDVVVAGGMESMSNALKYLAETRVINTSLQFLLSMLRYSPEHPRHKS